MVYEFLSSRKFRTEAFLQEMGIVRNDVICGMVARKEIRGEHGVVRKRLQVGVWKVEDVAE